MTYSCIINEPCSDVKFLCVGNLSGVHHLVPCDHHLRAVFLVEGPGIREESGGHQYVSCQPVYAFRALLSSNRSRIIILLFVVSIYTK